MKWIKDFQLFLFDFDGLLVDTESFHYQAYLNTLDNHGCKLNWSFYEFAQRAHVGGDTLKEAIYTEFPKLQEGPLWKVLYQEKADEYVRLIGTKAIELMPGVEILLKALKEKKIRSCVVTNSPREHINIIRARIPILDTIPHWITREDYLNKKPHPECYLRAIQLHGEKGDRIIGFEDTLKGLTALQQSPAQAVLICPSDHPQLGVRLDHEILHFESFDGISSERLANIVD